jgi:hypothetical protein
MIWLLYIAIDATINYWWIEVKKKRPDYLLMFIARGIFVILYGVYIDIQNPREWWPILAFQLSSFWIIFDLLLNSLRGRNLLYKGKNSGWIDRLPSWIYYPMKLVALGYIIYYLTI